MSSAASVASAKATFPRGVHPAEAKHLAENAPIEVVPAPSEVLIPLLQHTGAPCAPTGKPRQQVAVGDVIGDSEAFVSAPIHASVAGKTAKPRSTTLPNGRHVSAIPIKADRRAARRRGAVGGDLRRRLAQGRDRESRRPKTSSKAVRAAGIVGLGGAAFPTHVKLPRQPREADRHPAGQRLRVRALPDRRLPPDGRGAGAGRGRRAARGPGGSGAARIVIGSRGQQARRRSRRCGGPPQGTAVEVAVVRTKYPQGGEKQLIPAVLGPGGAHRRAAPGRGRRGA